MEFLVFLAVYVVRRKLDQADLLSAESIWRKSFARAQDLSPGRATGPAPGFVIIVVPGVLLALGEIFLRNSGWSLAIHPLAFVLLIGLMGTPGLGHILDSYTDAWRRGDMQSAWRRVCDFLPPEERGAALSPEQLHRVLSETLISAIFERYFVVAFWYVIGGLGGAFVASGFIALRDYWPDTTARPGFSRLANILNYLPARLLGLTFGIAGDLAGWLKGGKSAVLSPDLDNSRGLMDAANSALTGYELEPERFSDLRSGDWPDFGERSLAAIRGLMNRSMLVWICALALLVIAGVI